MPTLLPEVTAGRADPVPHDDLLLLRQAVRFRHLLLRRLDELGYEVDEPPPEPSLEEVEAELATSRASAGERLGIDLLARRCELDPLEQELLLFGVAVEQDAELRSLLEQWPGSTHSRPTVRQAQEIWGADYGLARVRACFGAAARLRRQALLALVDHEEWDDATSAADSEYQVSDRVVRFLLGERGLAPYLQTYARLTAPSVSFADLRMPRRIPDSLRLLLTDEAQGQGRWWGQYLAAGPLLIQAVGLPGAGRFALAEAVAHELGLQVLEVDYEALSQESADFGHYLTRLYREAALQGALVVFVNCQRLLPGEDFDSPGFWVLSRKLELHDAPTVLCLEKPLHFHLFPRNRRILRADMEIPPAPFRREMWQELLPADGIASDIDIWNLAKIFNFGGGGVREMIREAANLVLIKEGPEGKIKMDDLMAAGRELQSRRMGKLTRRMIPRQGLKDLIVQPRVRRSIEEIVQTVRYRHIVLQDWGFGEKISTGKGMSALFSGPPGTGKSMAAGVIAHECGMNLFRVNLAMVVSKWVGETEERLSKVFEQARESHSILLFDEADALFAKRSKVKSAQDKYANLEVNHLLQEVESFEGMVILTTNLESSIDKAFMRRLNFRVFFPKPEAEDRALIWRAHMPARAPFAPDIDWKALAEDFDFTGGYIKNAMLRAAQWAAEKEGVITQEFLCRAAEAEMAETGRVIREVYQEP